ncbi:MAG: hypothetical protein JW795_02545 [Chitinivibrionales bacterium]|nr:hypothetical protein [Chitinivibrionales bacterium]
MVSWCILSCDDVLRRFSFKADDELRPVRSINIPDGKKGSFFFNVRTGRRMQFTNNIFYACKNPGPLHPPASLENCSAMVGCDTVNTAPFHAARFADSSSQHF